MLKYFVRFSAFMGQIKQKESYVRENKIFKLHKKKISFLTEGKYF